MFLHLGIDNAPDKDVTHKKLALIDEQSSPLQRIMWVYDIEDPEKRTFENNICTFHIGNGYFLSVAHNLRIQSGFFRSIDAELYRTEIFPKLDGSQNRLMEQYYYTDEYARKKYLVNADPMALNNIAAILKQKRFDTRWVSLSQKKICNPYLIFQFKNDRFYNDLEVTDMFHPSQRLFDADAQKHTFLLPVELVEAFYGEDIALYRIINTPMDIIDKIPTVDVDYSFIEEDAVKMYCLQSSPSGPTGRLLNEAYMEGMLDHFGIFQDDIGGNYLFEGYRYLIKGYFRFGSSGAPYLIYNADTGKYVANAVQSEASGIQLSIKNDREGNFQYINAIASPLYIIKERLQKHLLSV
jgi:hypothetical protein